MYGGLLGGFDQPATLRSGANAYEMTFKFTQPACDYDLATILPFDDYITNTLTLEHKAGLRFAIFNVTSNTADPQVQTVPRKVSTVSTSSTPTSSATDVQQASSSGTGTNSTSAPVKNKGVPVLLMCASGARAQRALAVAKKLGYEQAQVIAGGLKGWKDANLPVEKAPEKA